MQGLHLTGDLSDCRCAAALLTDARLLEARCIEAVTVAGLTQVNRLFHAFASGQSNTCGLAAASVPGVASVSGTASVPSAASVPSVASGSGITGVVLLAESHLAVHTWPEMAAVTLDVYVCNYGSDNAAKAHALFDALCAAFDPRSRQTHALQRGSAVAAMTTLA